MAAFADIFVTVDPEDAIASEIFDFNNVGWRDFAGADCFPTATVPEPKAGLLGACTLLTLALLRRRAA